jgi:hypothetical protein
MLGRFKIFVSITIPTIINNTFFLLFKNNHTFYFYFFISISYCIVAVISFKNIKPSAETTIIDFSLTAAGKHQLKSL